MSAIISGVGVYYPENILTNADLEKLVDTSDTWIRERTGIEERRILPKDSKMKASDLGVRASEAALKKAGIQPEELDGIIVAGLNPDMQFPATACFIQDKLGAKGFAFDVTAACAGFVYGVNMASLFINSGQCKKVLVVGAELISPVVDWTDRNTCILFGDAAGAVVLTHSEDKDRGVFDSYLESKGAAHDILSLGLMDKEGNQAISMDGRQVFKLAVKSLSEVVKNCLEKNNLTVKDVNLAVFHQANSRILSAVATKLGLEEEQLIINVQKFGNTSSASIPLALAEAEEAGRIKKGDLVVFAAIGGGMSWGCNLIRW